MKLRRPTLFLPVLFAFCGSDLSAARAMTPMTKALATFEATCLTPLVRGELPKVEALTNGLELSVKKLETGQVACTVEATILRSVDVTYALSKDPRWDGFVPVPHCNDPGSSIVTLGNFERMETTPRGFALGILVHFIDLERGPSWLKLVAAETDHPLERHECPEDTGQ